MVDATKYGRRKFIKAQDVEDGPIVAMIAAIEEDSRFDKLILLFDDGKKFSLNKTNVDILIKAFGKDTRNWPDHEVELSHGKIEFNGDLKETVIVKPMDGEAVEAKAASAGEPADKQLDDEIPF
jgi:hypothetical protein